MTRRLPAITAAVVLTAVSSIACSGSPLATAPFAPSAVPAMTLSAESGDASDTWGALDKGKDKGKGKDGKEETTAASSVVEAEGVIATATGTCPARTFTIGTHSITTSTATKYEGGACADLLMLAEIEVRAERQTDGTLVAAKVEFEDTDEADDDADKDGKDKGGKNKDGDKDGKGKAGDKDGDDADDDAGEEGDDPEDGSGNPHHGAGPHSGTVSSFRGACPTVTFNLKSLRVSTTNATKYVNEAGEATCEILRPNVKVLVTGEPGTASRTFVAATVTIVRTH